MSDATEEMEVYVDTELLIRAKGALMLDNGREPTTEEVIGEALQALVDEHTDDDERPSLDLSPTAGFRPVFDEAQQIDRRAPPNELLPDGERHYPGGFDERMQRANHRVGDNDSNSADK